MKVGDLQYTLLLLIPLLFLYFKSYGPRFTIHFATINTILKAEGYVLDKLFTIHFATINTRTEGTTSYGSDYLQYTLLLLIRLFTIIKFFFQIHLQYTLLLLILKLKF